MARRWLLPTTVGSLLAAALLTATPAHAADVPDVWPSENGGPGNAAINPGETALKPGTIKNLALSWDRADATSTHGAPTIVDGVGYEIVNPAQVGQPASFQAFSPADGNTLWSVALSPKAVYPRGISVAGTVALMSFDGTGGKPGGVSAVGLSTQRLLWSTRQPANGTVARTVSGPLVTDGSRAYLLSAAKTVTAYGLSDGALVWKTALTGAQPTGVAVASNSVIAGGSAGVVAYDTTNGKKQWKAPGVGAPVAAGGRVVTSDGARLVAVAAGGCGSMTCSALWDVTLPYAHMTDTAIGGVDGVSGYLVFTDSVAHTGGLVRFGAVSGKVLWKGTVAAGAVRPVRGATTVWTVAGNAVVGFSTTATAAKPAVTVTEPATLQTDDQALAVADGTVFVRAYPGHLGAFGLPAA